MNRIPKIYCLTVPGSTRHKAMDEMFRASGMRYEFVYGKLHDACEIPYSAVCGTFAVSKSGLLYHTYANGVYGCHTGMRDLVQKMIDDGCEYAILCQDDIILHDGFKQDIMKHVDNLERVGGAINISHDNGTMFPFWLTPDARTGKDKDYIYAKSWAGDVCYLLTRDFAKKWLGVLLNVTRESDVQMTIYLRDNNISIAHIVEDKCLISLNKQHADYSVIWNLKV